MNIVITGASRGIGYEAALNFSGSREHKVYALSRNVAGLNKLLSERGSQANLIPVACDITQEEDVETVVRKIAKEVNGIDVLINNAGQLINKPFEKLTLADWRRVYDVNVFGAMNVTRALLPLLMKGELSGTMDIHSHVLNISSIGGIQGSVKFKGLSAYSSSKGALITMTECLSEEFRELGVHVNCLALGSVETEMFREAFPEFEASAGVKDISGWIVDFALKSYPFFNGKVIQVSTTTP